MKQIANIKHSWFNPLHKTVTRYNQEWWGSTLVPAIRFIGGTLRVYPEYWSRDRRTGVVTITPRIMDSYTYSGDGIEIQNIYYPALAASGYQGNTILATGDLTYLEVAGVVLVDKR